MVAGLAPLMMITGGVEFALPEFPEFEACGVPEEVTDVGRLEAVDWLNRAANWGFVRQIGEELVGLSVMQSLPVLLEREVAVSVLAYGFGDRQLDVLRGEAGVGG